MIGAIETTYKGYRFRSRLEARWAVFFDVAGIEWRYETEGFEVNGHRYLPDFYLPKSRDWVEVKGDPAGLRNDFARMCAVLSSSSPLPGFADGTSGLILLGDIPDASGGTVLHPILTRREGVLLQRTWGLFVPQKGEGATFACDTTPSWLYYLHGKHSFTDMERDQAAPGWQVESWIVDGAGRFAGMQEAYRVARQSRFEHGEQGARAA